MIYTITASNIDQILENELPVVIDFYADWCGPCKMIAPIFDILSKKLEGQVIFGKVNTDTDPYISKKFGVSALPTMLLIKNKQIVNTLVGFKPMNQLETFILS